ncbi:DUF5916 domain-containing protein [Marilutibacter chinensis]|uniref:DUF5916 domain-containing protein n=1 Tax=Marilutibacter chinensis TaxID=2912247 RepID=A0ABS9HWP6_9GAMM|nr:DUF5916 domain-containing protein [Lysobacter chinensis]MCF7223315.1 DUF5916 domain-containing protein [Lysobacter chinensis]
MNVGCCVSQLSGAVAAVLFLGAVAPANAAIVIDGKLDEPEWAQAARYDDFRLTEPFQLTTPDTGLATEARLLSTPDGIVVGFRLQQEPGVQRVKPRLERDNGNPVDSVNFIVDFNGDGNTAYSFTVSLSGSIQDGVVSNENVIGYDWDTDWSWAVSETEEDWQVEMQIPWTVAPMRGTDTQAREMTVYFSRQFGGTGERAAFPAVTTENGSFLSAFERVEVPQYRKALFHYWPYVTASTDLIEGRTRYKAGVDMFWKPSPNFQLSATVNPDFGQVEADDIVINFDAIEVFFSDRRPFFTENQSLFDVRTGDSSRLVHTRRIGAEADDGSGISDINAALKLNGSFGNVSYGVMAAVEDDAAGRDFYAARLLYPVSERLNIGWLGTFVDRPFLDRSARVNELDMLWRPTDTLLFNAQWLGTSVDQQGLEYDDTGYWLRMNWTPTSAWAYRLEATHFGRDLNFNDLGFMRRNNLSEQRGSVAYTHRFRDEDSPLGSTRLQLQAMSRENDFGDRLPGSYVLVNNYSFRNGNRINANYSRFTDGWEDLISRGNGLWRRSARNRTEVEFASRRYGDWAFGAGFTAMATGLSAETGRELELWADWFPSDAFNASLTLGPERTGDWLIWEGGTDFGRYSRRGDSIRLGLSWFPGLRHELRLKSEWVAIRASDGTAYVLDPSGDMRATGAELEDFDINSFGLQLRYRYLIGPQSDVYLAYSRGGESRFDREDPGLSDLLDDALSLRDSDQVLVKVRYRF